MMGDVCMSFEGQKELTQQIFQSHVQFGMVCLLIGFSIPYVMDYLRKWYYGRTVPK